MDLGNFSQGQHKHFLPNSGTDSFDEAVAKFTRDKQKTHDNSQTLSLYKFIKEEEDCQIYSTPMCLTVKSEEGDSIYYSKNLDLQQFKRYIEFNKSLSQKERQAESTMFIYPLFIHTYVQLLEKNNSQDAGTLVKEYKELIVQNENYVNLIEHLVSLNQYEDILNSRNIKQFIENKYVLKITEETYGEMETFFTKDENTPFLEFIQSKIDLTLGNSKELNDDPEAEEEPCATFNGLSEEVDESNLYKPTYKSTQEYKNFLEAKKNFDYLPPNPPSLICWGIHNFEQVSCAEINEKATNMVTGSLTGQINISKLEPPMLNDIIGVPINTVPLATPCYEPKTFRKFESCSRKEYENMPVYGNRGAVYDVAFVPESKYFLSVSSDHYMRAYSLDTYNCIVKYSGHNMNIWCVECSSKGLVLTGSQDTTARLWNLEYLYPLRIFAGHRQDVVCAKFHPNCVYIATGSFDKAVRLWSTTDGAAVRVFAHHESPVLSLAFSPCGKYIASGGMDGQVIINDLSTCRQISNFNIKFEPITSLNWNAAGDTLAVGSLSGTVSLYAWPTSKIGMVAGTNIVTYDNVFQRILNVQYKKSPPSQPICVGVPKANVQETFVIKESDNTTQS